MRAYAYALVVAVVLALVGFAAQKVYQAGENACEAKHARAADAVAVETERRDQASAGASESMLDYLSANLPPIETQANESIERVRTVYRDRPVPAECVRPDGVQADLDAARDRANAAASHL